MLLHYLPLSLIDLKTQIFTWSISCSAASSKECWPRDQKGVDWFQLLGTSWMWKPSGKLSPGVRTTFPPFTVLQSYFVTREWINVAIRTLLRSVPTQNRSPPPNAMKCFVPQVISGLSCSDNDTIRHRIQKLPDSNPNSPETKLNSVQRMIQSSTMCSMFLYLVCTVVHCYWVTTCSYVTILTLLFELQRRNLRRWFGHTDDPWTPIKFPLELIGQVGAWDQSLAILY
jgi:hypothetical protein